MHVFQVMRLGRAEANHSVVTEVILYIEPRLCTACCRHGSTACPPIRDPARLTHDRGRENRCCERYLRRVLAVPSRAPRRKTISDTGAGRSADRYMAIVIALLVGGRLGWRRLGSTGLFCPVVRNRGFRDARLRLRLERPS